MKKFYTLCFLGCLWNAKAQELAIPTFTQYLAENRFVIAPSYAGIGDNVQIRLNGLTQWVGIKDAPDNQSLAADMRLGDRSGIGVFLYNDKNGNTRQSGAKFSFAHHLILDKYSDEFLSLGLSYNMNQFRLQIENFNGPDMGVTNDRSAVNHNFDVSALYRFEEFYISLAASNILNKDLNDLAINEPNVLRNYQLYTGYTFKKKYSDLEVEPSMYIQLFESDGRSTTDLNLKLRKRSKNGEDYVWGGVSYRFLNDQLGSPLNIGPMAGLKSGSFYFAYSYQVTTNNLMSHNSGTHMVTLGVDIFQGISNCSCTF